MTRSPLLLAAVGAALALGACGSSDDDGGGPTSGASRQDKAFEGALKFSKCMRDHGVDFPDPQRVGTGGIKLTGRNINPNDPKTKLNLRLSPGNLGFATENNRIAVFINEAQGLGPLTGNSRDEGHRRGFTRLHPHGDPE